MPLNSYLLFYYKSDPPSNPYFKTNLKPNQSQTQTLPLKKVNEKCADENSSFALYSL